MGGFAKDTTPFSEFLWADFLRRKLTRKAVDANFDKALEKALAAAKSKDAIYLPGWCGPAIRRLRLRLDPAFSHKRCGRSHGCERVSGFRRRFLK